METPATEEIPARVERLLRDAHIQRMRSQWAAAETLCRQALELAPEDTMGLEMLGDLLLEKGSLDDALASFRKAHELQPQRGVLEEKIARAVLLKDEEERERLQAQLFLSSPKNATEQKRNNLAAVLISFLCPGGGQLFKGQYQKGIILLAVGVLCLFLGAPELLKGVLGFSGGLPRGEEVNSGLAVLGLVGMLVWLYSLLDAATGASGDGARFLDD